MFPRRFNLLLRAAAAIGTLALPTTAAFADADGDAATDDLTRVIPYEGTIEVDGAGFTGALDLRFTLYDAADTALWTETYAPGGDSGASEPVYAGACSASTCRSPTSCSTRRTSTWGLS